jgi:hypothetical protein
LEPRGEDEDDMMGGDGEELVPEGPLYGEGEDADEAKDDSFKLLLGGMRW